ncbi:hypothetical protein BLNAU_1149 [Blattamonas nauphoetae]|uniref:Uncharacterized protein n=1 Tax=Blattamonas nauphoetae TaxID=2049346 RepID=A0ABQ9YJX9_9EUKA|nr:hypothetical protein BLNAU_1149 [Blattamonas nauphoetae]
MISSAGSIRTLSRQSPSMVPTLTFSFMSKETPLQLQHSTGTVDLASTRRHFSVARFDFAENPPSTSTAISSLSWRMSEKSDFGNHDVDSGFEAIATIPFRSDNKLRVVIPLSTLRIVPAGHARSSIVKDGITPHSHGLIPPSSTQQKSLLVLPRIVSLSTHWRCDAPLSSATVTSVPKDEDILHFPNTIQMTSPSRPTDPLSNWNFAKMMCKSESTRGIHSP